MSISKLVIENFKGVAEETVIPIKPLTIFIGPNSSGKSTCIHALAALSQTVKLPNTYRPLLLDDEFAYVHLGRFIEIIHSKSYNDSMRLGVHCDRLQGVRLAPRKPAEPNADGCAIYEFKSTKRTQEIFLKTARYSVNELGFSTVRTGEAYRLLNETTKTSVRTTLRAGFALDNPLLLANRAGATEDFLPFLSVQRGILEEIRKVSYLGPFRQSPLRRYPTRGSSPREVGAQGEATITLLANEMVQFQQRKHIKEITAWLKMMGLGTALDVSRVGSSDLFDVSITMEDGESFPIVDLGYGLSQILPVLAQCSFAEKGATLLFEQPEIHLHTIAAKRLIKVFIDTINRKSVKVLAETHSPDLIHQLQTEIRDGNIERENIAIYRVQRVKGRSVFKSLELDDDASIYDAWEAGLSTT